MFIKRKVVENAWVHYTPGWDCHGLPIELKALSAEQAQSDCLHPLEVRSKARALAERTIEDQKRSFREWFISSDWRHCYYTFSLDYSLKQLRAFYDLYSQALIFRDTMPVYWSPSTRTALAEAELQYNQSHTSRSVFLKYGLRGMESCSALVWTTTPWTLLANEAIAFSEKLHYCLVEVESQVLLLARELLPALGQRFEARFVRDVSLEEMHSLSYEDPFDARPKRMIASGHVTTAKGTGLVHVSPHHGLDDFRLAQQYGLPVRDCLVNREGLLEVAPGICLPIIEDNRASDWVLGRLEGGHMLAVEDYQHSYPYDWRTGKPVIIKPSQQWFLNMDPIRDQCLQQLSQVRIYPEVLRKEMESQLRNRPNWCLSRQRKWGVPIPVFYERHNPCQPILNDQVFSAVMRRFQQEGCDVWWKEEPESLLRECSSVDASRLVKGEDILDIWFDSGCSWLSVLPDPPRVADLYLEGIDQIRGWFQSSLITSVALRGRAPFKAIFIHGFALDSTGRKMSKSEGNVIDPMHVVRGQFAAGKSDCGVDGLRFWVARHASSHNDVLVDVQHFRADVLTLLNRVRNSFRFLLGYLCPPPHTPLPAPSQLTVLDKYLLFRLAAFHRRANQAYDDLNLNEVVESLIRFFLYDFSTFYLTRVKDRLYCERRESAGWRSALAVLHHTYHSVAFQLAPITPHLVLEANLAHPLRRDISLWDLMNNLDHFVSDCLFPGHSGSISSAEHFESLFALLHPLIADLNRWSQSEQVHLSEWQCHLLVPPHCLPSLQVSAPPYCPVTDPARRYCSRPPTSTTSPTCAKCYKCARWSTRATRPLRQTGYWLVANRDTSRPT